MTIEVILNKIKYLRIHNVSIHINFYQNRLINECFRKKILYSRKDRWKDVKTEFFFEMQKNFFLNNQRRIILIFFLVMFILETQYVCNMPSSQCRIQAKLQTLNIPKQQPLLSYIQFFSKQSTILKRMNIDISYSFFKSLT